MLPLAGAGRRRAPFEAPRGRFARCKAAMPSSICPRSGWRGCCVEVKGVYVCEVWLVAGGGESNKGSPGRFIGPLSRSFLPVVLVRRQNFENSETTPLARDILTVRYRCWKDLVVTDVKKGVDFRTRRDRSQVKCLKPSSVSSDRGEYGDCQRRHYWWLHEYASCYGRRHDPNGYIGT